MRKISFEDLPEIKRIDVNLETLAKFVRDDEFTGLAVDLMVETGQWSCIAASTMGDDPAWDRDHAAICGNMVRLYKLLHSVLDQTCQRRQETSFILSRLVFETIVNIQYMIINFSPELIISYVSYSLRHEKKLRDSILKNIQTRSGVILPIEERMLRSIDRAALAAKISLDEIDTKDKRPWGGKNLFEKAQAIGLDKTYLAFFGGPSHSVHGNWHELYSNHLHWDENGAFTPNLGWHRPRPQILFAICFLVIATLRKYFEFMCGKSAAEFFEEKLSDLENRVSQGNDAHENYLSKKTWPEI